MNGVTVAPERVREALAVHVTREDILLGHKYVTDIFDPVARALERQYPDPAVEFFVSDTEVLTRIAGRNGPTYDLPPEVTEYIANCDTPAAWTGRLPVQPITFTMYRK